MDSSTEDMSKRKVGTLSEEIFFCKEVVWKIPGILSVPEHVGYSDDSPSFSFANAIWCLRIYPNGQSEQKHETFVNLIIARLHSSCSEHEITFRCGVKTRRNKEFKSCGGVVKLNDNLSEFGVINFMERRDLKKKAIVCNGILTLFCHMSIKEETNVESSVQSEITEPPISNDTFLQEYNMLILNEVESDLTIRLQGQQFRVHRDILSIRSSVFASMLSKEIKEKTTEVVDIDDCDPAIFLDFLFFMYTGSVKKLSTENVFGLYSMADKYDVRELKSECVRFMICSLSVNNFYDIFTLALRYSEKSLIKIASCFFSKHMQEIIATDKWQAFLVENPTQSKGLLFRAQQHIKRKWN